VIATNLPEYRDGRKKGLVYFDGGSKASFHCILRSRLGPSKHLAIF